MTPANNGKQKTSGEKKPSEGGAHTSVRCFKCGVMGHRDVECRSSEDKCYKCGKSGHKVIDCKGNIVTCYKYGEQDYISTTCQKPKKDQTRGYLLALSGAETTSDERLI